MAAMESCRVSWGQVSSVGAASLDVQRRPLVLREGKLALGEPRPEQVARTVLDRGFVDDVVPGDWVSIHWGWACEVPDARRLANPERWTTHHLALANRTI